MYLTHAEYVDMGGTLSSAAFSVYETEAAAEIDKFTFGRISEMETVPERVKQLAFRLVKSYAKTDEVLGKSSEGVGSYSVSYEKSADIQTKNDEAIRTYLANEKTADGTPLLYRGCE
jgi:hypothetical protein